MPDNPKALDELNIQIYADGAKISDVAALANNPLIAGFTTNPSLMKSAGITNYQSSAKELIFASNNKSISFEVFADDFEEMERQAKIISTWGDNVFAKIPITNTKRESSTQLIGSLLRDGVSVNVTAIMTADQVLKVSTEVATDTPSIVSVFAGRIADTGINPEATMKTSLNHLRNAPNSQLLWASTREVFNIFQADTIGCDIITVTPDILAKLPTVGKNLIDYSADTVSSFYNDASESGYTL
jgi:transaldolase